MFRLRKVNWTVVKLESWSERGGGGLLDKVNNQATLLSRRLPIQDWETLLRWVQQQKRTVPSLPAILQCCDGSQNLSEFPLLGVREAL